jgi:hypothetical protein
MNEKDRKRLSKAIKRTRKNSLKSKRTAFNLLVDIGMITKNGNLRHPYKDVCIPQKQA